jgi:hypothetical protein
MATKKSPTDVTGRNRDELASQFAETQVERAGEMSLATAEAAQQLDQAIDATKPNRATVIVDSVINTAKPDDDTVEIRVVESIDSMTLGAGNYYSFKAGQKYVVSRHVANHLKEKGYLAANI